MCSSALAKNCNAPVNKVEGATSQKWKKGKPVRVLRGYKLAKHSKYAPTQGVRCASYASSSIVHTDTCRLLLDRYDGLYKVVSYKPVKGKAGHVVWQFLLRRDDPTPAPWTREGKQHIQDHGLDVIIVSLKSNNLSSLVN